MMVGSGDAEAVAEGAGLVGDVGVEAEVAAVDAVVLCGAGAVSGVEAEHAAKERPTTAAKKISAFLSVIINLPFVTSRPFQSRECAGRS